MNRLMLLGWSVLASSAVLAGDLYYFKGTSDYLSWSDPASWSLTAVDGEAAAQPPGAADRLYGLQNRYIDLGGESVSIDGISSDGNWDRHSSWLKHGALTMTGNYYTHSDTWNLVEAATLTLGATSVYRASNNHGAADEFFVGSGCELNILGVYQNYKTQITVAEGGECTLDPGQYGFYNSTAQKSTYTNSGRLTLPNGLVLQSGTGNGGSLVIKQLSGVLTLGGPLSKNGKSGGFSAELSGGVLQATGDVSFDLDAIGVTGSAFEFAVDAGKELTMGAMTYAEGAVVTKSGEGRLVFDASLPSSVRHMGGEIAVTAADATLSISKSAGHDVCTVEIGAKGLAYASTIDRGVRFKVVPGVFETGDVILSCENEAVLSVALADLSAAGLAAEIVGSTLVKAESSFRFISTTVTNLADPAGWADRAVPGAGAEVFIEGAGVTAVVSSTVPEFSKITVKDGAELKVALEGEADFPCVALVGTGRLTVSGRMTVPQTGFLSAALGGAGELPVVEVLADGVLTVPGGMNFKNVDLRLTGSGYEAGYATLQTVGDGPLTIGCAAAGEQTKIAFTSVFGKVLTPGTRGKCNTRFACADAGGSVEVVGPMLARETEFRRSVSDTTYRHGFNIGCGMDPAKPFDVIFDACRTVDCLYDTTFEGGAVVTVTNGTVIGSTYGNANGSNDHQAKIRVLERAKIVLEEASSLQMAISGNWAGSYLDLSPSEDGWESLVVRNGSFVYLGRQQGNDKARITVEDGCWECFYTEWWGNDRMQWIFNHAKEVNVPAGRKLTIRLANRRFGSDQGGRNGYYPMSWTPIVGGGDVVVGGIEEDFRLEMESTANACTGTLAVDGDCPKSSLFLEDGVVWAGKAVFDGRVAIGKSVWTDASAGNEYATPAKAKSSEPATVTLGAVELAADFTLRLWGSGDKTNDVVNVTGEGWSGSGSLLFSMQDGYDVQPGDRWVLGTAPKGSALPSTAEKWQLAAEEDPADAEKVFIVLSMAATDNNFVSNASGSTYLGDPTAWQKGTVPVGKEVSILGPDVVAEISDGQPLPDFASIAVKGGATLRINADLSAGNLPPIAVDAVSRIEVKNGAALTLPADFQSFARVEDGAFVSMAKVVVETNAVLTVRGGMKLKNVDLAVFGTLASTGTGQVVFGHANAGETAYFAFAADGATVDMPGADAGGLNTIDWLAPETGGRVKAVGEIIFRDTTFKVDSWKDHYTQRFCYNNASDEAVDFIFDRSVLNARLTTVVDGAARMVFRNGGRLTRTSHFAGHYGGVEFRQNATAVFEGADSGMDFETAGNNNNERLYLNPGDSGSTVVTLKDGAYLNMRKVAAANGAVIAVDGSAKLMVDKKNNATYELYSGAQVAVPAGAALEILATAGSSQGSNVDRDCAFLGSFAGAGEVRVSNRDTGKAFRLTMTTPSPDFAGSIKVVPSAREDSPTTLCFASAGDATLDWSQATVVADGNVALTNVTDGATAAAVTFGTLAIERGQSFDIRLWRDGSTIVCDTINLTAGATGGGRLNVVPQDGAVLDARERFILGTAPAGAWRNLFLHVSGSDGRYTVAESPLADSSLVTCTVRMNRGLMLTIR